MKRLPAFPVPMDSWDPGYALQQPGAWYGCNEAAWAYLNRDVHAIYGAVIGDICGSIYEFNNWKTDNPGEIKLINPDGFFTDDTVLTAAVASAIGTNWDYEKAIYEWAVKYPNRGYGGNFACWLQMEKRKPYNSYGNGAAMRISPLGWLFQIDAYYRSSDDSRCNEDRLRYEVAQCTNITHNHREGIKGAYAVALAIFLARKETPKEEIKARIESETGYDLDRTLNAIRPNYRFDESCQGTVPEAFIAFFESHDFVSAIQNAISLGGDSDTLACITGSIAEAFYGEIPQELITFAKSKLDNELIVALEGTDPKFTKYCSDERYKKLVDKYEDEARRTGEARAKHEARTKVKAEAKAKAKAKTRDAIQNKAKAEYEARLKAESNQSRNQ
jgi:ADP-ribosylglycohydrolase